MEPTARFVDMDHPRSRATGAATCAYAIYALARPGHLADALGAPAARRPALDALARTYGVRDLSTSALLLSADPRLRRAAVALRVASDLGDCAVLAASTSGRVRAKVVAVTLGWAALNTAALLADERA
jgi:hypothetical protein